MITGIVIGEEYYQYARITQGSTRISVEPDPVRLNDPYNTNLTPSGNFTSPSIAVRCRSLTPSSKALLGFLGGPSSVKPTRRFYIHTNQMLGGDSYWVNVYNYFVVIGAAHNSYYSYNVIDA
jgi:hypothetical protein